MATSRLAAAGAIKGAFEDLMTTTDGLAAHATGHAAIGRAPRLSSVLSRAITGTLNTTLPDATTYNYTSHHVMVLEADFDAVRFILPYNNASATSNAGVKVACAVSNAWVDPTVAGTAPTAMRDTSTSTWVNCTFSGAASTTLAQAASTAQPTYQATDWVELHSIPRTDGGTLPVLMVRVMYPTAASHNYYAVTNADPSTLMRGWNTAANVAGRGYMSINQATDGVTTPANFTQTTIAMNAIPVIVEYVSRRRGVSMIGFGDSIMDGSGSAYRAYGHAARAAFSLSTASRPVSCTNLGWGGQTSTQYWQRAMDLLDTATPPTFLVYSAWSPNDESTPITAAKIATKHYQIARLAQKCESKGTTLVLVTGTPVNHTGTNAIVYGSSDSLRRNFNTELLAMASVGHRLVIDADGAITTGVAWDGGTGQYEMAADMYAEALHPSDAGNTAIAAKYAPIVALAW